MFYINVQGFHWNISGNKFFELHAKFEELHSDTIVKIAEIAEHILTLGHTPFHSFSVYLENATIKEVANVSDGSHAVCEVLRGFNVLIKAERELLTFSGEGDNESTNALNSDYIREQEKLVWMYSAYLRELRILYFGRVEKPLRKEWLLCIYIIISYYI